MRSGDGYISQSDLRLHFGLGKAPKADKIVIRWPSGLLETLSWPFCQPVLRSAGRQRRRQQQNPWRQFGAHRCAGRQVARSRRKFLYELVVVRLEQGIFRLHRVIRERITRFAQDDIRGYCVLPAEMTAIATRSTPTPLQL